MYKLTERAADDFAVYIVETWLNSGRPLYRRTWRIFRDTGGMPNMGRNYYAVPGVMHIEFQRHAIFYMVRDADVLIARILHQQMNHKRHLL